MKVKALTPFVHNRYDLNEGQEVDMPEATANDLKDAGLVEIVGDGEKPQRAAARPSRQPASAAPVAAGRTAAVGSSRPQNAAAKNAQLPENKMAPAVADKGDADSSVPASPDVTSAPSPSDLSNPDNQADNA